MSDGYELGSIHIKYYIGDSGDMLVNHVAEGDLPVALQVGLLELTKDTILRGETYEEEE